MENSPGSDRIRENLEKIKENVGRCTLVAVTKTVGIEEIRTLKEAGHSIFGENRVDAAEEKARAVEGEWHMIGHLQSGKARKAVEVFDWIDTVDSEKLVRKISSAAVESRKTINILVQVNIGEEEQKSGIGENDVEGFISDISGLPGIEIRGLLAMAPFVEPEETRPFFKKMKKLYDTIKMTNPKIDTLSMGMTNDFQVAIEEGATMVRVGTALWR